MSFSRKWLESRFRPIRTESFKPTLSVVLREDTFYSFMNSGLDHIQIYDFIKNRDERCPIVLRIPNKDGSGRLYKFSADGFEHCINPLNLIDEFRIYTSSAYSSMLYESGKAVSSVIDFYGGKSVGIIVEFAVDNCSISMDPKESYHKFEFERELYYKDFRVLNTNTLYTNTLYKF